MAAYFFYDYNEEHQRRGLLPTKYTLWLTVGVEIFILVITVLELISNAGKLGECFRALGII